MINEVIQDLYIAKNKLFPEDILQKCKDNFNEPQFIPNISQEYFKIEILAKVFSQMISIEQISIKQAKQYSKPEDIYKFEGKSVDNQSWFKLGFHWIEDNFKTKKPELFKRLLHLYVEGNS